MGTCCTKPAPKKNNKSSIILQEDAEKNSSVYQKAQNLDQMSVLNPAPAPVNRK